MRPRKQVPDLAGEVEERAFWETRDTADYVHWSRAHPVRLPNLKPSTTAIWLRLPVALLERIKLAANQRAVAGRKGGGEQTDKTASRRIEGDAGERPPLKGRPSTVDTTLVPKLAVNVAALPA